MPREMPSFEKSPPELKARFAEVLDRHPEAEPRQMFGHPAAFVGGNLATSLFHDRWVVRLPESEVDAAMAGGAGIFEPVPGRPMKAFVLVPVEDVAVDAAIEAWVERGIAHAASLPKKKPKKK